MSQRQIKNVGASVRERLLMLARERREDFNFILNSYGVERLLYRLSKSAHNNRFILKGAMLFVVWGDRPHRPTRDLDLLGHGHNRVAAVEQTFREICETRVEDDGLEFDPSSIRGEQIQTDDEYDGVRLTLTARLARARIPLQVDVGFGDSIVLAPDVVAYPVLLHLPEPRVRAYPKEAVVSEKYQAMVQLGMGNSRMKDFYDLWILARRFEFDGSALAQSIQATFDTRKTALPTELPLGLTPGFHDDTAKQAQWRAFVSRGRLEENPPELADVASFLAGFLMPPTLALVDSGRFEGFWPHGGPWGHRGSPHSGGGYIIFRRRRR